MNIAELTEIQAYHLDRLIDFGPGTTGALGWKNGESHQQRLSIFSQLANFTGCSVLDVGCGHGDLHTLLSKQYEGFSYTGIDQMQPFLDIAVKRYGRDSRANFILGDFTADALPKVDYVIASGALNYRSMEPDFIFSMIAKLYRTCSLGLGFNLLSRVDFTEGILVAYDPATILAYCQSLSSRVDFIANSVGDEFTLFVYK